MKNPLLSDTEFLVAGAASVVLLGLGVYLLAKATAQASADSATDDLEDTAAVATLATVV
jgi:hypothetical protein